MPALLAPPSKNAIQKTLASQLLNSAGDGDPITFDDVDGIQNLPGILVINRIDANGEATPSKREYIEYSGTSGSTVLIETRNVDGSNSALTHAVGSIVEFIPSVTWADRIYDALANVVDVTDLSVDTSKIVTPAGTQTLTNKTITTPVVSGGSISGATLSGNYLSSLNVGLGSDATGDLYYRSSTGTLARLGLGTSGQVLTANASLPYWAAASTLTSPSFQANRGGSAQSISASSYTKVAHNNEVFDSNTNYDPTTNYRFTPTVAGKYLVIGAVRLATLASGKILYSCIYKNGTRVFERETQGVDMAKNAIVSSIVDMNGSTDYLEHFVWTDQVSPEVNGGATFTYFTASKIG